MRSSQEEIEFGQCLRWYCYIELVTQISSQRIDFLGVNAAVDNLSPSRSIEVQELEGDDVCFVVELVIVEFL